MPKVMPSSGIAPIDRNMIARKATPKKLRASAGSWLWPLKREPTIKAMMTTCKNSEVGFRCMRGMRLADDGKGLSLVVNHRCRACSQTCNMACGMQPIPSRANQSRSVLQSST